MSRETQHTERARRTTQDEQRIQERTDAREARSFSPKGEDDRPPQTGARDYPYPPLPAQHLKKPGNQADLELQPMWEAPYYRGSGKLEGKVALITGADSGIGRAVALLFAREGADIAIGYLSEDEDAEITKAAVEKEGRRALLLKGDIASPDYAEDAVKRTVQALGGLDVLVNNAAFQEHAGAIEDLDFDQFDRTLKTNLYGLFNMCRAAVPHLKPGSSIINTGSETALKGSKALLDYSLTKGGIHAFTRSLSESLLKKGVRVNAVAPGPVWTPLNPADQQGERVAQFGAQSPMKRPAQPEEIAPAFVFLASPQTGSYITGEVLPIIGGYES